MLNFIVISRSMGCLVGNQRQNAVSWGPSSKVDLQQQNFLQKVHKFDRLVSWGPSS